MTKDGILTERDYEMLSEFLSRYSPDQMRSLIDKANYILDLADYNNEDVKDAD